MYKNFDLTTRFNDREEERSEKKMRERNYTLVKSLECFQNRWENVSRIIECVKKKRRVYMCVCLSLLLFGKNEQISQTITSQVIFLRLKQYR
jgi:hypothetical protein